MKLLAHISIRSAVLDSLRRVPKHPWAVDFPEGTIRDLKDAKDVVASTCGRSQHILPSA
jgi:hypothetical protein